ncbi:MAG: hypothetical protein DIU68_015775 [Chloroflexota bacterium]|nr:MAG: hypothetical protein DIU68_15470 [Chloroflexota bacterium]
MEIQAALTRFRDHDIVIVWVNRYVLSNDRQAAAYIRELENTYFCRPVVLVAPGPGKPIVYGCDDTIVEHVANTPLINLPWARYVM